jgi:simple sugar transport system permease protein
MAETMLSNAPLPETEQPPERSKSIWYQMGVFFLRRREASILIIAVVLAIYFGITTTFFTNQNLAILAAYAGSSVIVAVGEVFLLICGEIDLSVGATAAFAPFVMYFLSQDGVPLLFCVIIALLACAAIGLLNGAITVWLKVPSLITTLGTQFLISGLTLLISQGEPIITPLFGTINNILGGSDYVEFIWAVAVAILFQIVLSFTRWGLYTFSAGGNILGSSEAGIPVNRIKITNFILVAMLGGLAGILDAFRVSSIDPLANGDGGTFLMFAAVAGAVIGGTALMGGVGTVIGALLGCLTISIVQDGLNLLGVNAYFYDVVLGIAILIAMIANIAISRWREAGK